MNGWQLAQTVGDTDPQGVQRLLDSARWYAVAHRHGLHEYPTSCHLGPARAEQESRRLLDEQVASIEAAGGTVTEAPLRMGDETERIMSLSEELGAGLVVVGSRGFSALRRAIMGSLSESVVRHAHCPVMVVRQEEETT